MMFEALLKTHKRFHCYKRTHSDKFLSMACIKLSFLSIALLVLFHPLNSLLLVEESTDDIELKLAVPCDPMKCLLPYCRCSGMSLPLAEFRGQEQLIPQFVTVTFDDAVNAVNFKQYEELFEGVVNSDHCPARGTFYVSHEYTDYSKVNALYNEGHEIALHSVTHGQGTDYWRNADIKLIMREFGDEIKIIEKFAKVNARHIRGIRLPFLQIAGNATFEAIRRLGLTYDASWPTIRYQDPAMWPYTLDYLSMQDCQIGPCPDASIPGVWVSPMVVWTDTQGYSCSMIDGCIYPPNDEVDALFNWMMDNFNRHYNGNRAPFGMYLHAAWFARGKNYFSAFKKFLHHVKTLPHVYITTTSRVIQYMRQPVLGKPFKGCLKKPKTTCIPKSCGLLKQSSDEQRYMTVCDHCPSVYPWIGNPLGAY